MARSHGCSRTARRYPFKLERKDWPVSQERRSFLERKDLGDDPEQSPFPLTGKCIGQGFDFHYWNALCESAVQHAWGQRVGAAGGVSSDAEGAVERSGGVASA